MKHYDSRAEEGDEEYRRLVDYFKDDRPQDSTTSTSRSNFETFLRGWAREKVILILTKLILGMISSLCELPS